MRLRQLLLVAAGLLLSLPAQAQTYPTRPIRLISPFAAGGAHDVLARPLALKLADRLGGTLAGGNPPGAGAAIWPTGPARSPPAGYTLGLSGATRAVSGGPHTTP